MVPEDWSEHSIGDIASIQVGRDLKEDRYSDEKSETHIYPVYSNTVDNLGLYGFYDFEEYTDHSVTIVGRGAGLGTAFSRRTGFGAIGRLLVASPINNSFDVDYLANYINFSLTIHYESGGIPQLPGATFAKYKVLLPPISEQTKIAKILYTWDKAITTTERLLTSSQQQKQALMQQLLTGQKRFAGFTDEWKAVRLGDVAKMNSGGTPASAVPEYYDGNIPWVSIADMTKHGKLISKTERYISQLGLDNSSARIYPKNTILYAMYASIGECSIALNELASSQAILGIQPSSQLNYLYLYYYLSSLKEKIKTQGQQGTQANLNAGMVKDFNLQLPSLPEQQKIAQVLSTADAEIANLQAQLAKLKLEKKALMQQLLTGLRRVQLDAEAVA